MYQSLQTTQFVGETAQDLATQLRNTLEEHRERSSVNRNALHSYSYVLFWGPPGDEEDPRRVLEGIPSGIPAIGSSADVSVINQGVCDKPWSAVCITSPFLTPHASFAPLTEAENPQTSSGVVECIQYLLDNFEDSTVVSDYFNDGKDSGRDRMGAYGVTYNRPAFLLLFLPGMGVMGSHTMTVANWPATDNDYEIVEVLTTKASRNLVLFGGSAVSGWTSKQAQAQSWVAARRADDLLEVMQSGIVGLLIESDLSFGCASAHGFKARPDEGHSITKLSPDYQHKAPFALPRSRPIIGHVATQMGTPAQAEYQLNYLQSPLEQGTPLAPTLTREKDWHTLVCYEGTEVLPNPPYQWSNNEIAFLRPMPEGATLYHAVAQYEEVLGAAGDAVRDAIAIGKVQRPEWIFSVGCRGRIALLGNDAPYLENERIRQAAGPVPILFGMYGDGETCPSTRGRNMHWNWTTAILVMGGEYNAQYMSAAQAKLLGEIDRALGMSAELIELEGLFRQLVETATVLTQTDCCQIRTLSEDGTKLVLKSGSGPFFQVAYEYIDVTEGTPDQSMITYEAYRDQKPVVVTKAEYEKRIAKLDRSRFRSSASGQDVLEIVRSIEHWSSFPITDSSQKLGMLNIDSQDPRFRATPELEERFQRIANAVADRAARPIRSITRRRALVSALTNASNAQDSKGLAEAIVEESASLLGHGAYLSLLLPDNVDKPTMLKCFGTKGPTDMDKNEVFLHLGPRMRDADKGVCGWVFERGEEWASDNARDDANGHLDSRGIKQPIFKQCFTTEPPITANYAVPLRDPETNKPIGVLNAEAPPNVLDKGIHLPVLRRLSAACATAIHRAHLEDMLWKHLEQLLPPQINQGLRHSHGRKLDDIALPCRTVCTVLCADIRGYTNMSRIVGEEVSSQ